MSLYEHAVSLAGQHGLCLVLDPSRAMGEIGVVLPSDEYFTMLDPAVYINPHEADHGPCPS